MHFVCNIAIGKDSRAKARGKDHIFILQNTINKIITKYNINTNLILKSDNMSVNKNIAHALTKSVYLVLLELMKMIINVYVLKNVLEI